MRFISSLGENGIKFLPLSFLLTRARALKFFFPEIRVVRKREKEIARREEGFSKENRG